MLPLYLQADADQPLKILCLGAHCDDIEIGCGGTILKMLQSSSNVSIYWHVFCSTEIRKKEETRAAEFFCSGCQSLETKILNFRDGYLPAEFLAAKEGIEQVKQKFLPDVVFTHYRHDRHQDHREVSDLTWNTFRDQLILEYEIPKWDGDMSSPNAFISIDSETAEAKIAALQSFYVSQAGKNWFDPELFRSIMRIRGMESNSTTGLAEAFYLRKTELNLTFESKRAR